MSRGNFRMTGNGQWVPDQISQMDLTSFLVIDHVAWFAGNFYYFLTGKNGEFVRHIPTATKVPFIPGR